MLIAIKRVISNEKAIFDNGRPWNLENGIQIYKDLFRKRGFNIFVYLFTPCIICSQYLADWKY